MLTGRSAGTKRIAFSHGRDGYLRKPFDPDELVVTINTLLVQAAQEVG
jgi:DNA-binding response OmpR family regulator